MSQVLQFGWVFLGGGLGAVLRFWLANAAKSNFDSAMPWGTVIANLAGSFMIGMVCGLISRHPEGEVWRPFLVIGVLGGFTTFSAFSLENLDLLKTAQFGLFAVNVLVQVGVGLALTALGWMLASRI